MPLIIKKKSSRNIGHSHGDERTKNINRTINEVINDSGFDSIIYELKSEINNVILNIAYEKDKLSEKGGIDIAPIILTSRDSEMCSIRKFIDKNEDDIWSGYIDEIMNTFKADTENKSYLNEIYIKLKELEKATKHLNEEIKKCVENLVATYCTPAIKELEEEINKFKEKDVVVVVDDEVYAGKLVSCNMEPWEITIRDVRGKELAFKDKFARYMIG